jgi:hypothetical protein
MAGDYNSGLVNFAGTVSTNTTYPVPGSTQSTVYTFATGTGASQTVLTVGAGKKGLVYGANLIGGAGAGNLTVYKPDGTTALFTVNTTAGSANGLCVSPVPIWIFAAGEAIKATCSNTYTFTLFYLEVPA